MPELDPAIMGAIVGAVIAAIAMLANSVISTLLANYSQNQKERRTARKTQNEEMKILYKSAIDWLDKLIRNYGLATKDEWSQFHQTVHEIKLFASKEINEKFRELEKEITEWAHELPELPKIFIPKFEEDSHRKYREEARENAEVKREKIARKKRPKLRKKFEELIELVKKEIQNKN